MELLKCDVTQVVPVTNVIELAPVPCRKGLMTSSIIFVTGTTRMMSHFESSISQSILEYG
eukprot:13735520-Ditylum_brightwellii.AAC.1